MIQSTVNINGGKISEIIFIDEDDESKKIQNEMEISNAISSIYKNGNTGGIILNYLYKYNELVFKYLDSMLFYHGISPSEASSEFVIVTMDIDRIINFNTPTLLDSHIVLGINYISKETSPFLYGISSNTYGNNHILKKIESRGLIAIEFILDVIILLENSENGDFLDFIHNNVITTSLGSVQIDIDNYYPSIVDIYIANSSNILYNRYVLSNKWSGETFRITYQNVTLFPICNVSNENNKQQNRLSINVILLVSLSGNYKLEGYRLLLSYLSTIDYTNNNSKLNGLYINPIIIDTKGGYEIAKDIISKMSKEYNTKIALGLDNSINRKEIVNELEENDILLVYPYDFEGYECKENIIYIGVPFTSKITYIPWILGHLNNKIYIVYTDSYDNELISKIITHELSTRGYNVIGTSKLPETNYILKEVTHLIHMKMKTGGVILSFLKGNAGKELYQFCYDEGLKYPNYNIVSDNLNIADIDKKDGVYMLNHYIWNTYDEEYYDVKDYVKIYNNKYTYISSETSSFIAALLSVKVMELTCQEITFSGDYSSLFTVEAILNKIHNVSTPEITIYNNNFASFTLSMKQIKYNESTQQYYGDTVYKYKSKSEPNPWSSTYNLTGKYICNWNQSNPNKNETIEVDAVSIALIFPLSDVDLGDYATDLLESAVSTLSDINDKNSGVNGLYIDYIIFDYKSESELLLTNIANQIIQNQDIVSVFGCLSEACKNIISNVLKQRSISLWYPGIAYGEICDEYIYYTNSLTNQIIDPLINYLTTYKNDKSIVIISDTRSESETITKVLQYQLGSVISIEYTLKLQPIDGASQSKIIKIIEALPNGAIFICTTGRSNFKSIINGMNNAIFTPGLFSIITIGIDRDILSSITLSYLYDFYIVSPYFQEYNNSNIYYQSYNEYTGLTITYMVGNALYIAFHLWKEGVEKANSFDSDKIRYELYNTKIESGAGVITMHSSNYITNPFFLGYINPISKELIIEYQQLIVIDPMPFNWNIDGSYGKVCDFSNNKNDYETTIIPFVIVVAIAVTGYKQSMESGIYNVIDMCITDINSQNNGLLNHRLYMEKIDIGSDESTCYETLPKLVNSNMNINVIFTTASELCINILLSQPKIQNIPIFQIGFNPGEACHKDVIYGGKDPSVIERVIDVMFNVYDDSTYHYSIIGTNDQASQNCIEYSTKYLEDKGATVYVTSAVEMTSITDTTIDHIVNNIHDQVVNGCYILFFGTAPLHKMVDDSLKRNGFSTELYKILSFTTADIMLNYDNISSFYSAQSYFPSSENDEIDNQLLHHIKEYTNVPITEYMINSYNVFQIWSETALRLNTVNWTEILPNMYDYEFNAPEGNIKLRTSNYLDHFLGISKYNVETKKFDSIYNTIKPITPVPWKKFINDGRYLCDFSSNSIGSKKKQSTISIGLLVSYSGDNSITERSAADGIIFAVNEVNDNGGLLGKIIIIEKRDPQSLDELYISYAKELSQLDAVKVVFGGGRFSTQKLLVPIFDTYHVIYFYPGITGGSICSKYCFSTQTTVNQYTSVLLKYVLPYYTNVIFISENTQFAKSLILSLEAITKINNNHFYTYLYPNLDGLYNNNTSLEFIKTCAIFIVANAESYSNVINDLCDNNINPKDNGIYAITADENRLINVKSQCIKGLKIISTFTKTIGIKTSSTYLPSAESFVQSLIDANGESQIFTPILEAGYTSLKLYVDAVESAYSVDSNKVNKELWGYNMNTPTGTMNIGYNGYANRVIFLCEAESSDSYRVVDYSTNPEYADTYDQYIPENYGYVCDWTDNDGNGEKIQLKMLKIAFFHEYNVSTYQLEVQIMVEEYNLIRNLNENKINGYSLLPCMYFCSTKEEYINILDKLKNDTDLALIIGCRSSSCRDSIIPKAQEMNKLFIYTGITVGLACSGNVMTFGTSARQKIDSVKNYLLENDYNSFLFVSSEETMFTSYYTILAQSLKESFEINQIPKVIISSTANVKEIQEGVENLISRVGSVRTAVFFYLSGTLASSVLQEIINQGASLTTVQLILMRFSRGDYSEDLLIKLTGALRPATYSSDLVDPLAKSFRSDMQSGLGTTINVPEEMEYVYSALQLWKTSLETSIIDSGGIANPPIEYVRLNMIDKSFTAPSGPMVLDKTLYVSRSMYIFRLNDDGKFIQVNPNAGSTILYNPIPYPDGVPAECNFGKRIVYFEYSPTMKAVTYVLMSCALILSIWSLLFTFASRNKVIIKSFGRSYSFTFAVQLLILSLSVIPMAIAPTESNHICTVRVVMLGLCVKGVLGLMLGKCMKLYNRYRRLKKNIKKSKITIVRLMVSWLIFELLECIILILWFTLDPNEYVETYSQSHSGYFYNEYIRECKTSTPFLYYYYYYYV